MVDEIIDVVEDKLQIELAGTRPGMLGTAVIAGKSTDLIDTGYWLTQASHDWFRGTGQRGGQRRPAAARARGRGQRLLPPTAGPHPVGRRLQGHRRRLRGRGAAHARGRRDVRGHRLRHLDAGDGRLRVRPRGARGRPMGQPADDRPVGHGPSRPMSRSGARPDSPTTSSSSSATRCWRAWRSASPNRSPRDVHALDQPPTPPQGPPPTASPDATAHSTLPEPRTMTTDVLEHPDAALDDEDRQFVTLTVADQLCGVPVLGVRDILGEQIITRIPLAPRRSGRQPQPARAHRHRDRPAPAPRPAAGAAGHQTHVGGGRAGRRALRPAGRPGVRGDARCRPARSSATRRPCRRSGSASRPASTGWRAACWWCWTSPSCSRWASRTDPHGTLLPGGG